MIRPAIISVLITSFLGLSQTSIWESSNSGLDVLQLAEKYGYPSAKYEITTDDGYILQMERIPYGKKNRTHFARPPVLLVPGLLSGSVVYANFGPKKSLAFILADNGYDVWLLNYRGSTYSRKHVTLNPDVDKIQYWNFSFAEIGAYDAPAAIDKILLETGYKSIYYIGHSLGSSIMFALLSEKPEYNQKIKYAVSMSPAANLRNTKDNIFTVLGKFESEIQFFAETTDTYEVLPSSFLIEQLGKIFCSDISLFQGICANIFLHIVGYSPEELDKSQLPNIVSTTPCGTSVTSILHSTQLYKVGFAKFDYGETDNVLHYGQPNPPLYNLSKVTVPIALFGGGKDALVGVADIEENARLLANVQTKIIVEDFNHIDFTWGNDAPKLVYAKIISLLKGLQ